MGASNSKGEDDKGIQLCRARKKFIKQALNGRCSLAAAHISYIEELKLLGCALTKFVESNDLRAEASRSATPDPSALIKKHISQSPSRNIDTISNISQPPLSSNFQSHHMKYSSAFSKKIEEKPPVPVVVSSFETPPAQSDTQPWDYFSLCHPTDENHFASQERPGFDLGSEGSDEIRHLREEEGIPKLEDVGNNPSSSGSEQPQESEDEFDEPLTSSLVRSFRNVNITQENAVDDDPPILSSSVANDNVVDCNKKKNSTPDLNDTKIDSEFEVAVLPKDFFSSMNEIEELFVKASESGQEVPCMLEVNKFQFRPAFSVKEGGSITSMLLKSCFSCGKDPGEVQKVPPQSSVKYLTWHRTSSSRSASSRNLLVPNSADDFDNPNNENLFDNSCMVSGSHASTLDRLYAWEKKLYDEVKAGQVLRSKFDQKCKLLRQKESRTGGTDKTRSAVKDLYCRIRVAIHRINSISRKIEEIRDVELQPQLEELIEGLRKMWEMMVQCHKLQSRIISISHIPPNTKAKLQSDPQRQITVHLEYQLSSLLSTFTKWILAQKIYIGSLNEWLVKCVSLPQKRTRRNKRMKPQPIKNIGPPIYMICGSWLEMIDDLPSKKVADSISVLANEVARFLPRREEKKGKSGNVDMLGDIGFEDSVPALDRFRASLGGFLGELNKYSECSLKMFDELQMGIQEAKSCYEEFKSQKSKVFV